MVGYPSAGVVRILKRDSRIPKPDARIPIPDVRRDVSDLRSGIPDVRGGISDIPRDVPVIRGDISDIPSGASGLRSGISDIRRGGTDASGAETEGWLRSTEAGQRRCRAGGPPGCGVPHRYDNFDAGTWERVAWKDTPRQKRSNQQGGRLCPREFARDLQGHPDPLAPTAGKPGLTADDE